MGARKIVTREEVMTEMKVYSMIKFIALDLFQVDGEIRRKACSSVNDA